MDELLDSDMGMSMGMDPRGRQGGPMVPTAVYGLKVPAGDVMVAANSTLPVAFRITMAAIDPSATPKVDQSGNIVKPRATLKLVKEPTSLGASDDEDDFLKYDDDEDDEDDDDDEDDEDEDPDNGDEANITKQNGSAKGELKAEKTAKEKADQKTKKRAEKKSGDEMDVDEDEQGGKERKSSKSKKATVNGVNGTKSKGKGGATKTDEDEESEEDSGDDDISDLGLEEFVLCTLDPEKTYQHPLDMYIGDIDEADQVFFKVSGTHDVYLTGNYLEPANDGDYSNPLDSMEEDYDEDDESEDDEYDDLDEEDELDDLEDPRITEIHSAEASPEPNKVPGQKKKNKRTAEDAEDESTSLDNMIDSSLKSEAKPEQKLSKKQLKKMKNNAGNAVPTAAAEEKANGNKEVQKSGEEANGKAEKGDKKVQFAKNLEQGPTGSPKSEKKDEPKKDDKAKASLGVKVVQGVKIADKKIGEGPVAKKGDKVAMRYIGKLEDGKVFDSNKKGKPFTFKLGSGEVIKGWDIGVAGMARSGERRITLPANMGYGSKAMPGIPANSTLVFDIKMLAVN